MNKEKMDNYFFNMIEDTLIGLWKDGKILRSVNPKTDSGQYCWVSPKQRHEADKNDPTLGGFVSYEEFQSQLN
jgi:hypothetical protein